MKIKDLKERIKDLPDDLEVMLYDFSSDMGDGPNYYHSVVPTRKAKVKLTKIIDGMVKVQSRPQQDKEAVLALIIE